MVEEEAEAEKTRKRKEYDEKKIKEESELKVTKEKLAEVTKKQEQLQHDKIKIFEHLKKVVSETNRHALGVEYVYLNFFPFFFDWSTVR